MGVRVLVLFLELFCKSKIIPNLKKFFKEQKNGINHPLFIISLKDFGLCLRLEFTTSQICRLSRSSQELRKRLRGSGFYLDFFFFLFKRDLFFF